MVVEKRKVKSSGEIESQHLEAVLALNAQHILETSALDQPTLEAMIGEAFAALQVGGGHDGFLVAFAQDADYQSPNFLWFKERYKRFVYVDRIITAEAARGKGIARGLYEMLFDLAKQHGISLIACEVNAQPPNPASDSFHLRMGFREVGRADLADRQKTVRYLVRDLQN